MVKGKSKTTTEAKVGAKPNSNLIIRAKASQSQKTNKEVTGVEDTPSFFPSRQREGKERGNGRRPGAALPGATSFTPQFRGILNYGSFKNHGIVKT
ncbi:hypothetical protein DdX_03278 [Ditylenchus destructor]|uniref:Uncharacterized protein n=1 Tax=Ditylenchus destructor TaxID=166010 RepID=A0AAD4R6R8_9BILA|nr:hypothetical protein DdX_03278 [Ditylenchus destructor]